MHIIIYQLLKIPHQLTFMQINLYIEIKYNIRKNKKMSSLFYKIFFITFFGLLTPSTKGQFLDLPKDVLKLIVREVILSDLSPLTSISEDEAARFEKQIQALNKIPFKKLSELEQTDLWLKIGRSATLIELVVLLATAKERASTIVKRLAALRQVNKKLQSLTDNTFITMILEELASALSKTYPFKNATIVHAAALLSSSPFIFQWLKNNLANYSDKLNEPTANALRLTPLAIATITAPQAVDFLISNKASLRRTTFNRILAQFYDE